MEFIVQADKKDMPKCPYCEEDVSEIIGYDLKGGFENRTVYKCPHCRSVLGFSSYNS